MYVCIYIYMYTIPPSVIYIFVDFQGTWGSMFPKLGVMFSFLFGPVFIGSGIVL